MKIVRYAPLAALGLAPALVALPAFAQSIPAASGTVLPSGGSVAAGQAHITSIGSQLTIDQSSQRSIIDWTNFSIGQGGAVQFNNGAGATLNRVGPGGAISAIDGALSATGSVYLINPSGVIIGKSGVVRVGGTFTASTQDIANSAFMAGGDLTFSGSSGASVINYGKVGALGGDVVMIASKVENQGEITASGAVGLLSGYQVMVKDKADLDGKFTIKLGGTSVTNGGAITAASVALLAENGNVYALAGNTGGVIRATQVSGSGGDIQLTAPGGEVQVASGVTLDASGTGTGSGGHILVDSDSTTFAGTALARGGALGGNGGLIETSGHTVDFTGAKIDTSAVAGKTGQWLVDPYDLTVDSTAATTIQTNLATTSVTLQTTASGTSGTGTANASGVGDINIGAAITWSSANTLTLDAYHGINIGANLVASGAGKVVLKTNDGGSGGDYTFQSGASLQFTGAAGSGQSLTINGEAYTLLYSMASLQSITITAGNYYALAKPLDATGVTWTPIAPRTTFNNTSTQGFQSTFEGLGNAVSNLSLAYAGTSNFVGLFATVGDSGVIRDFGTVGGTMDGSNQSIGTTGGLVGALSGKLINDWSTTTVIGGSYGGGLVARSVGGSISGSYATGAVSGYGYSGGLVAIATGTARGPSTITNSYAT